MQNLYKQVPIDKRNKIFEATMKEFTKHTYDKASTNQIIQDAGISKGLLFHYFKSKKDLYLATYDQCTDIFWELYQPRLTNLPTDFFDRLIFLSKTKLQICEEEPLVYGFILTAYEDIQHRFPEAFAARMAEAAKLRTPMLMDGIDWSVFRTDIDRDKALHYIYLSLESMAQQMVKEALRQPDKGLKNWKEKMKETELLVELFRNGIYRKEDK
ncbi:TetR/AcrR family transcriptional regulator [Shimazuella sp. AN120528]|uniref:TetR/AcrR family transcriptional regulator n=1 Tax=Shimazuella soli TaxID=1892854 RepID=UPI001F0F9BAB|nr:TetR/AcrR family transcriptional regulator [Shimazuella soli]MCH5585809.1 TetR/AcrR family transcriptional regulator [Shimazuella soli]